MTIFPRVPETDEEDEMSAEERAELTAELEAAIEEADRGEGVPWEEVRRELRAMADAEVRRRRG